MKEIIDICKTMSDETRMRILYLLDIRSLCVCQLQGVIEESQPKISKHLAKLRDMGFVKTKRQDQMIIYFLNQENEVLMDFINTISRNLKEDSVYHNDIKRLKEADQYLKLLNKE